MAIIAWRFVFLFLRVVIGSDLDVQIFFIFPSECFTHAVHLCCHCSSIMILEHL